MAVRGIINSVGTFWAYGKAINALKDRYYLFSEKFKTGQWTAPDWSYKRIFLTNVGTLAFFIHILLKIPDPYDSLLHA